MAIVDSIIQIGQIVTSVAAVIALVFTARSFRRVGRSDQVRLLEGVLNEVRKLTHEYNLATTEIPLDIDGKDEPSYRTKLDRMLDHIYGALNWLSFLVQIEEIKDPKLVNYVTSAIVHYYDTIFISEMDKYVDDPKAYRNFKSLYKQFKEKERAKSTRFWGRFGRRRRFYRLPTG